MGDRSLPEVPQVKRLTPREQSGLEEPSPPPSPRVFELLQSGLLQLRTVSGLLERETKPDLLLSLFPSGAGRTHLRREVSRAAHFRRVLEVLVLLVDVLHEPALRRLREADVVEELQVPHHLAEPHSSGVRADGDCKKRFCFARSSESRRAGRPGMPRQTDGVRQALCLASSEL